MVETKITQRKKQAPNLSDQVDLINRLRQTDPFHLLLDFYQVATLAGTTHELIRDQFNAGCGPKALRLGYRTIRFRASDVLHWLEEKAVRSA